MNKYEYFNIDIIFMHSTAVNTYTKNNLKKLPHNNF